MSICNNSCLSWITSSNFSEPSNNFLQESPVIVNSPYKGWKLRPRLVLYGSLSWLFSKTFHFKIVKINKNSKIKKVQDRHFGGVNFSFKKSATNLGLGCFSLLKAWKQMSWAIKSWFPFFELLITTSLNWKLSRCSINFSSLITRNANFNLL